jgi:hypothetical protein
MMHIVMQDGVLRGLSTAWMFRMRSGLILKVLSVSPDKKRPDLGDHDEVRERALMKRKMEARRKAELKRFRVDLMKKLTR